jgi:hypothetical protein
VNKNTLLAMMIILVAGAVTVTRAAETPETPGEAILACVPADALAAARVRMVQLAATDVWKRLTADPKCPYRKFVRDWPLALDPEKDIADAIFIVAADVVGGGERKEPRVGAVLYLARDTNIDNLFRSRPREVNMPAVAARVFRAPGDLLVAWQGPRWIHIGNREYISRALGGGPPPCDATGEAFWRTTLDAPGEVILAYRQTEAVRQMAEKTRRETIDRLLKPPVSREKAREFVGFDFGSRLGLDVLAATLRLDLSREADALAVAGSFASDEAAACVGANLAYAEPSVRAAVTAAAQPAKGPPPAAAQQAAPLYRVTYQGREGRLTATRAAIDRLVSLAAPAK